MTGDVIARQFERLGMTEPDARTRATLVERVDRGFTRLTGAPAAWRWFVPGRLEIFGKHTDYAGGRSLLAAVPRGIVVAARPRAGAMIRVMDVVDDEQVEVDATHPAAPRRGWGRYVDVVARRLALNFPGAPLGADIAIASDLPRAAGLSSSSALVVGIATALARRADLASRDEWRANITSAEDLAGYLGCVENGADHRALRGTSGVGTHGGSEDHVAILACRAGHVSQYRFVPVSHVGESPLPEAWLFVVASSGVQADKAGSVRERYNSAARRARALHDLWNTHAAAPARSLGAALDSAPDAADRLRGWLAAAPPGAFTPAALTCRLDHFIAEDRRAPEAARAFASADAETLGRLSAASQREADEWLGNQIPETRALVSIARDAGAWAATSFGAGFGGCVWALVPAAGADGFAREWVAAYERRVPVSAGRVEWFAARPGPALTEVSNGD